MSKSLLTLFTICSFVFAFGQSEKERIIGIWWNEEFTTRIEVFENNEKFYGKIIWLKNDANTDGTSPRLDSENPEKELQTRRILGLLILKNLVWDADDNEWNDGEIYSPAHGKSFSCYAQLTQENKLFLKGYVLGLPFLGASTVWTRYN